MRIAMVGYGRMARAHSAALAALPDVALDTVVGARPEATEAFASALGYRHVSYSLDEALGRADIDAVVITTPNERHATEARAALSAGKHVLCEIPLALSLAEAEGLTHLAAEVDRRLMVCHTERFEGGKIELRRRIRAGELRPLHVIARFHMLRRGNVETSAERRGWADNVLWHHGAHTVDGVLDLLGEEEARELGALFGPPWPGLGVPLDVALQWRSPTGVTVSVTLSHNAHWGAHDYRLICMEDTIVCERGALRNRDGVFLDIDRRGDDVARQDREFVAAVREGREPSTSGAAVLPAMRVLQAAWDMR